MRRREFLQGGVALGLAGLPLGLGGAAEPGVRRYKRLGRTAMEISDISLGSSRSFDPDLEKRSIFQVRFKIPYCDLDFTDEERMRWFGKDTPIEFAHSLDDQIGGQIDAGFRIIGFYEDDWGGKEPIDSYMKSFIATRAIKQAG